jgi:hypothetical protein
VDDTVARPAGPVTGDAAAFDPASRRWWQRLPVVLAVGALPVPFGLYFLAFVGIGLLLWDRSRESEIRAGGAVLLFWWAYSFREGDTTPYFGIVLLGVAAVLLVRGAWRRRGGAGSPVGRLWAPVLGAALAVVMAVVAFVPYGYRAPEVSRAEALRRTLAERQARPWHDIDAESYLVDRGRVRFVHKPLWFVVLFEPSREVERTADGQPCFSRREVWQVDAISGAVSRVSFDEARIVSDKCLPIRMGTADDLKPLPR